MANAIDVIRDELAGTNDEGVRVIGEYLTRVVLAFPEEGEKIKGRTPAKGAFEAMRKHASEHKTGNYAYVGPVQAAKIIDAHLGLTHGGVWAFEDGADPRHDQDIAQISRDTPVHDQVGGGAETVPAQATAPEAKPHTSADLKSEPENRTTTVPDQGGETPTVKPQTPALSGLLDLDDLLAGL